MYVSKVYSSDIEDRLDASFYQDRYVEPIRTIKQRGIVVKPFGELVKSISNGVEIRKYVQEGTPYLRVSDMKHFFVSLTAVKCVKESIDKITKSIKLEKNDVLISRSGNPGIASLVTQDVINSIVSSHILKVTLKNTKELDPRYLVTYLNSKLGKLQIERITNGCLVTEINHPSLELIEVPLLSWEQQREIARLVEEAESKHIEALNKIGQAKRIFISTLGIDIEGIKEGRTYKVSSGDLGDVFTPKFYYPKYLNTLKSMKEKFDTIPLGEITEIDRGTEVGSKNYRTPFNREDNDVPFIRTSDIINYEMDNYPDYYISEEIYNKANQDIRPDDILFTKDGKIGLAAMIVEGDKCIIASGIAKIRIKDKYKRDFSPHYVFLALATDVGVYQAQQRIVIASTIPHLSLERLGETEIPIISRDKQKEISNLVKKAFELKKEKKELIKKAKQEVEELIEKV